MYNIQRGGTQVLQGELGPTELKEHTHSLNKDNTQHLIYVFIMFNIHSFDIYYKTSC